MTLGINLWGNIDCRVMRTVGINLWDNHIVILPRLFEHGLQRFASICGKEACLERGSEARTFPRICLRTHLIICYGLKICTFWILAYLREIATAIIIFRSIIVSSCFSSTCSTTSQSFLTISCNTG